MYPVGAGVVLANERLADGGISKTSQTCASHLNAKHSSPINSVVIKGAENALSKIVESDNLFFLFFLF